MNYTRPNDLEYKDKPEDWLNGSLIFANALGHLLQDNEGVVVDIKGDIVNPYSDDAKKVIVFKMNQMININSLHEDYPAGTMIWMTEVPDEDIKDNSSETPIP